MISDQELQTARSLLQVIALFLPVTLGVTKWIVRELSPVQSDPVTVQEEQRARQKRVAHAGLLMISLLVASAFAWLLTIDAGTSLSWTSIIGWFLMAMAFAVFLLISVATLTDNFQWFE